MGEHDVSQGRSPRYPRFPLLAAVSYARRLYDGAHRSTIDTLTAYKVMGFAGKSGASATALGATRQFGLVESGKGGVRISDLGLRILQPSSQAEYVDAIHEAAFLPQVFDQIMTHFEELPRSDEPIRSYLIRTLDFSKSGADDCINSLRETMSQLPETDTDSSAERQSNIQASSPDNASAPSEAAPLRSTEAPVGDQAGEIMRFPLARDCSVELRFSGPLCVEALERLIKHVELLKEVWVDAR